MKGDSFVLRMTWQILFRKAQPERIFLLCWASLYQIQTSLFRLQTWPESFSLCAVFFFLNCCVPNVLVQFDRGGLQYQNSRVLGHSRRIICVCLIEYLNPLKSCPHLILEISPYHISLIEHFALRLLAYLWFIGYLKVQWELKPSASRLLFSGISSQLGSGRQTVSLLLGLGLKLSFLRKHIVRTGSGDSTPSLSYTAIGPDCWGLPMMSTSFSLTLFSLSLSITLYTTLYLTIS